MKKIILSNKNLIFSINGKDFIIKTDAGGIAKYSYNSSTNGTFELVVKFLGDEIFLPSQTNSNVQIKTNGIYLKVNSISSDKGKNVQLKHL